MRVLSARVPSAVEHISAVGDLNGFSGGLQGGLDLSSSQEDLGSRRSQLHLCQTVVG